MPDYEERTPREKLYVRLDPDVIRIIKDGAKREAVSMTAFIETAITTFENVRMTAIEPIQRGRYKEKD